MALDLELTGLDESCAEVVSIGFVPIDGLRVCLSGARRILVRPEGSVGASAEVHLLRDEDLTEGEHLIYAMKEVLQALEGRVLLLHFAGLDHRVLSRMCMELWSAPLIVPIVDTLALAHRRAKRRQADAIKPGSLRLPALRAEYGLPVAHLHGALSDAVATAELFLAMVAQRGRDARLKDFL